jgi:hypothetical protein
MMKEERGKQGRTRRNRKAGQLSQSTFGKGVLGKHDATATTGFQGLSRLLPMCLDCPRVKNFTSWSSAITTEGIVKEHIAVETWKCTGKGAVL